MKLKWTITIMVLTLVFFTLCLWTLTVLQYKNLDAINVASSFVDAVQNKDYMKAHSLTIKKGFVGVNVEEFILALEGEIHGAEFVESEIFSVFPFQSWGNYFRRKLRGVACATEQHSVDYRIDTKGGNIQLAFEVRVIPNDKCQWKVHYFQTHAY
ncbi:MAG: hypothetical protein ABW131_05345 [Candidatus Sedimenticola sp. 6PFRAG5]